MAMSAERGAGTNLHVVTRVLVVVPSDTDPPTRLGTWLRDAGLELDERRLSTSEPLPEDLTGFDGLLVLGGPQSSIDAAEVSPELVGVRTLLGQAVAADLPTLAVCLGAQLLAQVGGGSTRVGVGGPEVGRRWWPSATLLMPTRSSARCRSRPTSWSGTTTRSTGCRPTP